MCYGKQRAKIGFYGISNGLNLWKHLFIVFKLKDIGADLLRFNEHNHPTDFITDISYYILCLFIKCESFREF